MAVAVVARAAERWSVSRSVLLGALALISTQLLTWAATFFATVSVPLLRQLRQC